MSTPLGCRFFRAYPMQMPVCASLHHVPSPSWHRPLAHGQRTWVKLPRCRQTDLCMHLLSRAGGNSSRRTPYCDVLTNLDQILWFIICVWVCVSSSFCTLPLLLSEPLAPCPFHSGLQTTVASAKVWWSRSGCSPAGFGKKRHRYQRLGCTPQSMYFDKLSSMKPMGLPNMS